VVRLLDSPAPTTPGGVFIPRSKDHLYHVEHVGERFVVRTNDAAKNFRVVEVPLATAADRSTWTDVIAHRADTLVENVAVYDTVIAASVRTGGLRKVEVRPAGRAPFFIDATDPTYVMGVSDTPDPASTKVRYTYDSLTQPASVYELDLITGARVLLKQQPVPTFDPTRYKSTYLHATAADGTRIPVAVVHHVDTKLHGPAPLPVYG